MTIQVPVKERILRQVQRKLEAVNENDNNGIKFEFVTREELTEDRMSKGISVAILDADESFVYQTCYLECSMQVGFDFAIKLRKGDVPSEKLGAVFAELKRVLLNDYNLIEDDTNAQLCENIQIRDYLPDRAGPHDDVATGFANFDFIYREDKQNPYNLF